MPPLRGSGVDQAGVRGLAARLGLVGETAVRLPWRGAVTGSPPTLAPKAQRPPRSRRPPAPLIKEFGAISRTAGDTNPLITASDGEGHPPAGHRAGDQGVCVRLDKRGGHKLLDHRPAGGWTVGRGVAWRRGEGWAAASSGGGKLRGKARVRGRAQQGWGAVCGKCRRRRGRRAAQAKTWRRNGPARERRGVNWISTLGSAVAPPRCRAARPPGRCRKRRCNASA